jgi:hypothetical protein
MDSFSVHALAEIVRTIDSWYFTRNPVRFHLRETSLMSSARQLVDMDAGAATTGSEDSSWATMRSEIDRENIICVSERSFKVRGSFNQL